MIGCLVQRSNAPPGKASVPNSTLPGCQCLRTVLNSCCLQFRIGSRNVSVEAALIELVTNDADRELSLDEWHVEDALTHVIVPATVCGDGIARTDPCFKPVEFRSHGDRAHRAAQ